MDSHSPTFNRVNAVVRKLTRRKPIDQDSFRPSQLRRCLKIGDLVGLGIGSTLGIGIYILIGQIAANQAGPASLLSFVVAGVASFFAAMGYAEFACRVPRAGSAYVYSYTMVGEFIAFLIGWNLLLEYVIGTASIVRGFTAYLDTLLNGTIAEHFREAMPIHISGLSGYPDFFSFGIIMILTALLCVGIKESTWVTSLFTWINLVVIVYFVLCSLFILKGKHWSLSPDEVPANAGVGGFFPFGFSGVMSGAATAFYCFIGFDAIAATGEEAEQPERTIPWSITITFLISALLYVMVSTVSTLALPYYMLSDNAFMSLIFANAHWNFGVYVISAGAFTCLAAAALGVMMPMPRILYAMSSDGLIFRPLASVNARTKTPITSTILSGLLTGLMAMIFSVTDLANMMSIGTLLAYTLVSVSVLLVRYEAPRENTKLTTRSGQSVEAETGESSKPQYDQVYEHFNDSNDAHSRLTASGTWRRFRSMMNLSSRDPTPFTSKLSVTLIILTTLVTLILDALLVFLEPLLMVGDTLSVSITCLLALVVLVMSIVLSRQPQSRENVPFKMRFVPLVPLLSIFCNFYLMFKLSMATLIRFVVWIALGLLIYFGYGIRNSTGYMNDDDRQAFLSRRSTTGRVTYGTI